VLHGVSITGRLYRSSGGACHTGQEDSDADGRGEEEADRTVRAAAVVCQEGE